MADTVVETKPAINPETHDTVTGKSWKDIAKENERNAKDTQTRLDEARREPVQRQTTERQPNSVEEYHKRLNELFVENPAQAMIYAATHAMQFGINSVRERGKLLKTVKADLKKRYEDYSEVADEFDDALEDAPTEMLTREGIEMVFQGLRNKTLEAKIKKLQEKTPGGEPTAKIIGPTSPTGSGAPAKPAGASTLTEAQQSEASSLGLSDDAYGHTLDNRRANARKMGIDEKDLPTNLKEPLKRKKQ